MGWQDDEIVTAVAPMGKAPWEQDEIIAPAQRKIASGISEAWSAGYQGSLAGLADRGKMPDIVLDPHQSKWYERLTAGVSQMVNEGPEMLVGALAGGAAGSAVAGPIGTIVGGGAGGMAVPAAIRQSLIEAYSKGEVTSTGDFLSRVGIVIKQTGKEGLIGGITGAAGVVAGRVAGKAIAPMIGESITIPTATKIIGAAETGGAITGMAVTPAALEGRLPEPQEFMDAAIMVGGLKAAVGTASKMRELYKRSGATPAEVVAESRNDPQIVDDLTGTPKITPQIEAWREQSKAAIDVTGVADSTALAGKLKTTFGEDHFATVLLEKMEPRLKGFKVEVLSDTEWKYRGFSEFRQAQSDPNKMTISFREKVTAEGAVHEITHEATQAELQVNPQFRTDVRTIMDKVRAEIEAGNVEGVSKSELGRMKKAMKNEAEFVAYGLTSPEVTNVLRGIRGDGPRPTLFTQFVDALARAFGFADRDYTALHDLIRSVEKGMDESRPFDGGTVKDYVKGAKKDAKAAEKAAAEQATIADAAVAAANGEVPPVVKPHIKLKSSPSQITIPRAYEKVAAEAAAVEAFPGEKAQAVLDHPFADIPETRLPHQINLTTIDGPEALKATMARMQDVYAAEIAKQTRGTVGHAQTEAEAAARLTDLVGLDGKNMKTGREPGSAANAVELKIRGDLLMQSANEAADLIAKVKMAGADATDALKADALAAIHRAALIQAEFTGAAAEVGRALNYLGKMKSIKEGTEKLSDLVEMYGKDPDALLLKALGLDNPAQMLKFAKEVNKATAWDKIVEGWKASLVSGPITQIANVMGNLSFMATRPLVDAVALAMPKMGSAERVVAAEPLARVVGNIEGAREGLALALKALVDDTKPGEKAEHRHAIEGRTGYWVRTPFRVLAAGDALFKEMNAVGEAYAQATRLAAKEGFNPATAEFRTRVAELRQTQEVIDYASRMTFNAKLGEQGRAVNNFVRKWHLEWAVPFISTPANVFKEMARLTPAAPIIGEWRAAVAKGGPEAQRALAELALGASLSAMTFAWALGGNISGAGDPDFNKRRVQMASGWQPYSIKVGDKWYSYQRIQPVGTLLGLVADMAEAWEHMTPEESDKVPKILGTAFANAVTNQTFLQGLANVVGALSEPDRKVGKLVQMQAASLVPGVLSQTAQLTDPYVREIQSVREAVMNRIPGLREELTPKRDPFGAEMKNADRVAGILPVTRSQISDDKVRSEAARLKVGSAPAPKTTHLPAAGDRKLGEIELTPEQRDIFGSVAGKTAYDALNGYVNSPSWDLLPDMMKKKVYQLAFEQGNRAGNFAAVTPEQRQKESERIITEINKRLSQGR